MTLRSHADLRSGQTLFAGDPATHGLPAFGRLCALWASRLGAPRLLSASRAQKFWIPLASQTLRSMAQAGAPLASFRLELIVHDERFIFSKLDAWRSDDLEIFSKPNGCSGRAVARFQTADQRPSRSIIAIDAAKGEGLADWTNMRSIFGDDFWAGAFLVGHEAGHALEAAAGWPRAGAGARKSGGSLGADAAAWSQRLGVRRNGAHFRQAASLAKFFEECVADATGAWAASLMGCPDPIGRILDYRQDAQMGYRTGGFLTLLPASLGSLSFSDLARGIDQAFDKAAPDLARQHAKDYQAHLRQTQPSLRASSVRKNAL